MVYKYFANTNATAHGQKMMMNTQIRLDIEEMRKFVGDFNKLYKDLEECRSNRDLERSFFERVPQDFQ